MSTKAQRAHGLILASFLGVTHFACGSPVEDDADGSGGSGPIMGAGGSEAATGGTGSGTGGTDAGTGGVSTATGGGSGGSTVGSGGAGSGGALVASGGASGSGGASDGTGGSTVEGTGGDTATGGFTGTCNESTPTGQNASGSGPHDVVIETNGDPGINEGTIYRPADLGGDEKYPIFVWGEGGCSLDGYSTRNAMAEIASHGYVVVADGTPNGDGGRQQSNNTVAMGEPLLAYVEWLIEENEKPCSAYYHSMDTTKVGANGFSCGGLMATGTAGDPRITTWGHTSSGLFSADNNLYNSIHTPVLIVTGSADSLGANDNGRRDYNDISASQDVPIMFFEKDGADHGGDLFSPDGGEFTEVILAWLNWWLKGDEGATGKGALVGPSCPYCSDPSWEVLSSNIP